MAKGGSFWSSIPGFLTGLAGVLTAIVTLVTLAFSQGWVGDGSPSGPSGRSGSSGAVPVVELDPETLRLSSLPLQDPSGVVRVTNGGTEPFSMRSPEVIGKDEGAFEVDSECPAELASGRSCELTVTFAEDGPSRARARLVVSVVSGNGGQQSAEVALEGTSVL